MRLLVDCDVLLDVALRREPHFGPSKSVLDWCRVHPNLYYVCSRSQGAAVARHFIVELLNFIEVAPVETAQAKEATTLPLRDFEDAMQAAAAVAAGAEYVITRNTPDYAAGPVAAIAPDAFLNHRRPSAPRTRRTIRRGKGVGETQPDRLSRSQPTSRRSANAT